MVGVGNTMTIVTISLILVITCMNGVNGQREWVMGNHTDGSAYDICAVGSPSCLESSPEIIDVAKFNGAAQQRLWKLQQQTQFTQTIVIIPGQTPNSTPNPVRASFFEHSR
jgi:hypothetical protein